MIAPSPSPAELADLLANSGYSKSCAPDQMAPLVYNGLQRLAHHYLSDECPDRPLPGLHKELTNPA